MAASERITLTLTLASSAERQAALAQFLGDVTTPGSSGYHHWLSVAEFASRFGATPDQMAAATAWLQGQGLAVDAVSPSARRLTVSGFTGQIQNAFAVSMHRWLLDGTSFIAPTQQPSLPPETAIWFTAIDGLETSPTSGSLQLKSLQTTFSGLAQTVDTNADGILKLNSSLCTASMGTQEREEYTVLLQQAAAQGISTLVTSTCATNGFPGSLAEATGVASPDSAAPTGVPLVTRPGWQVAPGLPPDALRYSPDLTAPSVDALAQTLTTIASSMPQARLGNVNPVLYAMAAEPGVFSQANGEVAGTWEAATGLGLVDLDALAKHYPRGTGSSFTSFSSSSYSPVHGQSVTFTSSVTSGTGGGTPTGTVSFVTSNNATLGTSPLVAGTATFTTNSFAGGSYTVNATYSGDGTYASSSSPAATLQVQPEAAQLAATVSANNTVGGSFSVVVTESSSSGVGAPSGAVTVSVSGSNQSGTAMVTASGANSASGTVTLPANTVGNLTLSINCTADASFSCYNPLTKGVTIGKATPALTFTFSPNPAISGSTISLHASLVAVGNAPVPTGNVEFFDGSTVLNAGTLQGGSTTTTGTVPTSATHAISATYDGDANYDSVTSSGSSSSGTVSTTTSLTSSSPSPVYGQGVTLTAAVSSASGSTAASGTVTFTDSVGGILGTGSLANGTATLATTRLPGGTSIITASYGGDSTHTSSISAAVSESVQPEADQVQVQVPATATFGANIPVTVTVTGASTTGASAPTGSVTLSPSGSGYSGSYSSNLSSAAGNGATATFTVPGTSAGTVIFSATYAGDRNYAASGPLTSSATISKANSGTTLTLNPAQPQTGQATVLSAQVASVGSIGPTGTVTFTNGGVVIGTGSLNASGVATFTTSFTAGNHVVAAQYNGDSNYSTSTSMAVNSSTGTVQTATVLSSSASGVGSGKSFTLTVNVAPSTLVGGAQPTGSVQILDAGVVLGTAGLSNGAATLTTSLISVRTHTLVAYYGGDSNYAASTSAGVPVTVNVVPTTTALSASSYAINVGQSVTLSATIQPANTVNGTAPTGTVLFFSAAQGYLGSGTVTQGIATLTTSTLAAGVYSLTASYQGDTNYGASSSTPVTTLTVTATSSVATLAATIAPTTAVAGTTAVISATVTLPGTAPPTGTVLATIALTGGNSTNTGTLVASGTNSSTALISVTVPPAGTYQVVVACPANAGYTCSPVNLTLISTPSAKIVTSTVLTLSPLAPVAGTAATLTATVSPASTGSAPLSGTVTFLSGTTVLGTGTIASGIATLSYTFTTSAAQSLTATYSGDTLYATSTSPAISTTTGLAATTTTLTSSFAQAIAGGTISLTAQVAGTVAAGTAPTGTVAFYVTGTLPRLLGSATLAPTGSGLAAANLFTSQIPAGTQTVYAVYSGDATFAPSTSGLIGIGLTDYSVMFTPASLTLTAGQSGNVGMIVTPAGGFTGTISMTCVPPADAQITCSITPSTLTNGGTSVLAITTVGPASHAELRVPRIRSFAGVSLAAVFGLLLLPRRRRRMGALLLVLLAAGLGMNLGCSQQNFIVGSPGSTGSPQGTATLTINTSGTNGVTAVTHDYAYQVTIQ